MLSKTLRQNRMCFQLAVSSAGRFLGVAVRALDFDDGPHIQNEGARQNKPPRGKASTEVSRQSLRPAAMLQTTEIDLRIALIAIFVDIIYLSSAKRHT
ncbi:MAG: hypothetical protein WCA85_14165 [Paraburkholderia sp.]|uniref:hypothetical protein n=1 Tax=Paraburkholderia sp. TaxID=1926495 RepID=UPI003C662CED